jgi:hypothetical protein
MDVGAAVAEVPAASPYRAALIASVKLVAFLPFAQERIFMAGSRG